MSAPALRASMKALVPDLAMVPRLFTRSALVMPIPESSMVRVLLACRKVSLSHTQETISRSLSCVGVHAQYHNVKYIQYHVDCC